jgi:hypothetical protein
MSVCFRFLVVGTALKFYRRALHREQIALNADICSHFDWHVTSIIATCIIRKLESMLGFHRYPPNRRASVIFLDQKVRSRDLTLVTER